LLLHMITTADMRWRLSVEAAMANICGKAY